MDRRAFIKLAGLAGLSVVAPMRPRVALADVPPYEGPLWVFVHAGGGWDPTMVCDPKGRANEDAVDPVNHFFVDEIEQIGAFSVAPVPAVVSFFEQHRDRILALNGIDAQTNSHQSGTQYTWSGGLTDRIPALGALAAASADSSLPLGFISNGGYDFTGGEIAAARVPDTGVITRIAFPYRLSEFDPSTNLFTDGTVDRIEQARIARHERQIRASTLPREQASMNALFESRAGSNDLRRLVDYLPGELAGGNGMYQQAQIAIASYKAGLTVSANMTTGGFDTHGDHDNRQGNALTNLFDGLSFLWEEAERQDVADRMVVVVGSDFGRTPYYNEGNGKDHWSITSMLFMGPGIRGGRVIGATDGGQHPLTVDPSTLALSDDGIRITPAHINRSLRRLAGFDESNLAAAYPLDVEPLDLFS